MKAILILLIATVFYSCDKNYGNGSLLRTNNGCSVDFSMVENLCWHPVNTALADILFSDSNVYYENNVNDGSWSLSNGCDSIYISRSTNNFYYRIERVTADSLVIINPAFGRVSYHR